MMNLTETLAVLRAELQRAYELAAANGGSYAAAYAMIAQALEGEIEYLEGVLALMGAGDE